MNQTPEFMTPPQASRIYEVPYSTLLRWLNDGTLTRYEVGGGTKRPRLKIRVSQLEKLLTPTAVDRVSA